MPPPPTPKTLRHVTSPSYDRALPVLWQQLTRWDATISQPATSSVGSSQGDRLHVQWWIAEDGKHFAAQIFEADTASLWEVFMVPVDHDDRVIAGLRICTGPGSHQSTTELLDAVWHQAFAPVLGDDVADLRHPAFAELVAAGAATARLAAIRDETAQMEALRSDVDYWSGLAKTLIKLQKDLPVGAAAPASGSSSKASQVESAPGAPAQPWRLRDIDRWAAQNTDRIVIMSRAISATKRSPYENADVLYASLEFLAHEYRLHQRSELSRSALDARLMELGLECKAAVTRTIAGTAGDQYFIRYQGARRLLEQHLSKGSARDPRFCMRIYFLYDEVEQKVVVGSMPAHLDTSYT